MSPSLIGAQAPYYFGRFFSPVAQRLDNRPAEAPLPQIVREPKIDPSSSFDTRSVSAANASLSFSAGNQTYDIVLGSNPNLDEDFSSKISVDNSSQQAGAGLILTLVQM